MSDKPIPVELTAKRWKAMQLIGVLLLIVGVVVRVGGEYYGVALAMLGVLLYAAGRVLAWWTRG